MILWMVILGCIYLITTSTVFLHALGFNWIISLIISACVTMIVADKCDAELKEIRELKRKKNEPELEIIARDRFK